MNISRVLHNCEISIALLPPSCQSFNSWFFLLRFHVKSCASRASEQHVPVAAAAPGPKLGLGVHLDRRRGRDRLRHRNCSPRHHLGSHPVKLVNYQDIFGRIWKFQQDSFSFPDGVDHRLSGGRILAVALFLVQPSGRNGAAPVQQFISFE